MEGRISSSSMQNPDCIEGPRGLIKSKCTAVRFSFDQEEDVRQDGWLVVGA